MQRVARQRIVILTIDPVVSGQMWLLADYLTEIRDSDMLTFPPPSAVAVALGGQVEAVPVPSDCADEFLLSFWAHPERVGDPAARAATSGFALLPQPVVDRVVNEVADDLATGTWDRRWGHLRTLTEYDAGLRLVVADTSLGDRRRSNSSEFGGA